MKLINIQTDITAQRTKWVGRFILYDLKYKHIFEIKYLQISTLITRGMEFIEILRTNKNKAFWNDVLHSWVTLQMIMKPQPISDILNTNRVNPLYKDIRYNSKIHYNVNSVCIKNQRFVHFFIDIPILFFRKTYILCICKNRLTAPNTHRHNNMQHRGTTTEAPPMHGPQKGTRGGGQIPPR